MWRRAQLLAAVVALVALAPVALARAGAPAKAPPPPAAPPKPEAKAAAAPDRWVEGAVFYEVFVRSFQDSNGDGKGDLPGLLSRLDYLNDGDPATTTDLGVDALWLMPIFPSPSYHGYDVTDYDGVNPDYGTVADLEKLVAEAHKRGVRVILDLPLNHTSRQHPWFKDSASGPAAPRRDWYVWSKDDPGWSSPFGNGNPVWHALNGAFYYAVYWDGMPDLNYRTPAVRAEARRIAKLWLDRGVDGFRLDGARHLVEDGDGQEQVDTPETHAFWKEFAAYVRSVKPEAALVGEAWTDTFRIGDYYGDPAKPGGAELTMAFDFPLATALVEGLKAGSAEDLAAKITEVVTTYPKGAVDAPFLTNHDQVRVAAQLEGDAGRLREAAAVLLTLPGAPFLYYGEELGLRQPEGSDDEFKRQPMCWDGSKTAGFTTGRPWFGFAPGGREGSNVAAETGDPRSLLTRYRELIALRHGSEALRHGAVEVLPTRGPILAFLRKAPGQTVLVAHNLGKAPATLGPFALPGAPGGLFGDPGVASPVKGAEGWTLQLPPLSTGIWRLK